jgi:Uma2 family endonuclease
LPCRRWGDLGTCATGDRLERGTGAHDRSRACVGGGAGARRIVVEPTVVIEVLSPSSEGDDEGDKRSDFQSLPSLEAYVLVAQDQRRVTVHRRKGGEWSVTTYRDGNSFELPTLSAEIPRNRCL